MCLYADLKKTKKLINKYKKQNKKTVKVYKVLSIIEGSLVSPYKSMVYKQGKNVPREPKYWLYKNITETKLHNCNIIYVDVINYGLHVYLSKKDAYNDYMFSEYIDNKRYTVVEFSAPLKDLVAVGDNNAVFNSLYLTKKEWDKARRIILQK